MLSGARLWDLRSGGRDINKVYHTKAMIYTDTCTFSAFFDLVFIALQKKYLLPGQYMGINHRYKPVIYIMYLIHILLYNALGNESGLPGLIDGPFTQPDLGGTQPNFKSQRNLGTRSVCGGRDYSNFNGFRDDVRHFSSESLLPQVS